MKQLLTYSFLALLLFQYSCGTSTHVTSSWKSPDAVSTAANFKKVMVVALLSQKDRNIQQTMETEMVNMLVNKGIAASSAYETFGPKQLAKNENAALKQLKNIGTDAVITITLLDKTKEKNYVPGNETFLPWGPYYNRFWGYYNYSYSRMYNPGYYTTNTSYFWESNLYDLNNNKLIYSVQTSSFDPTSAATLAKEYSQKILENMMQQGVLVQ